MYRYQQNRKFTNPNFHPWRVEMGKNIQAVCRSGIARIIQWRRTRESGCPIVNIPHSGTRPKRHVHVRDNFEQRLLINQQLLTLMYRLDWMERMLFATIEQRHLTLLTFDNAARDNIGQNWNCTIGMHRLEPAILLLDTFTGTDQDAKLTPRSETMWYNKANNRWCHCTFTQEIRERKYPPGSIQIDDCRPTIGTDRLNGWNTRFTDRHWQWFHRAEPKRIDWMGPTLFTTIEQWHLHWLRWHRWQWTPSVRTETAAECCDWNDCNPVIGHNSVETVKTDQARNSRLDPKRYGSQPLA